MNELKKKRIAAFLAVTALTSIPGVFAADTGTAVATEAPTYVDITINNIKEDTGLELGTGARARGNGSIATGTNSLALGKNAVATGGNENKETIVNKLDENKQRLQEIQTAQENTDRLMKEVQDIRKQQADVIEAGERVKQVRQSKANAKTAWDTALKAYNDAVASSTADIQAAQAKIDDFNSRLTAVSRIPNVDISSEEGITRAATQFKQLVEDGTTLNTDISFYKNYIVNYYKAEGDLRQAYITYSATLGPFHNGITSSRIKAYINDDRNNSTNIRGITAIEYLITYGNPSTNMNRNISLYNDSDYSWGLGKTSTYLDDFNNIRDDRYRSSNISDVTSSTTLHELPTINEKIDVASKDGYDKTLAYWQKIWDAVPDAVARYKNPLFTESDKENMKKWTYQNLLKYKAKLDTVYYQWEYEQTHDLTWLDKKKAVSGQLNKALIQYTPTETYTEMLSRYSSQLNTMYNQWKKENITDIEEKNKITVSKLTSELAAALNVNKDAVQQIQNKLAALKQQADEAKQTYENINPSAADLALAAQYDQVMKDLLNKSNSLKAEQERLDALKKALTLNDLTNVGENAMAIGTDALSTGTNSMAIGTNTIATGENSIAIGKGSAVTGTDSIAIGTGHIVIGNNAGTFGDPNTIYGDNSYAFGNNNIIGDANTPHSIGTNTFILGNNVTTTANNAVILGNNSTGADNTVSVGRTDNLRRIINVANGQVAQNSHDAVTGDQLWAVNNQITDINNRLSNANGNDLLAVHYDKRTPTVTLQKTAEKPYVILKVMDGAPDRFITQRVYLDEEGHFIQAPVISRAPNGYVQDTDFRTTFRDLDPNATYTPGQEIITKAYFVKSIELLPGLPGEGEEPPEYTPDTSDKITGFELYDDPGKTEDISHPVLTVTDTTPVTIKNLADGAIEKGSKEAVNGGQLYTELQKKANTDASNVTGVDKTKWQETLGDGKAEAGNKGLVTGDTLNTELNKKADKTDITNINADLANKANKDASNISTDDAKKWAEKLGTGTVTKGDTSLVTGDTVYNTTINKANTDMDNLTDTGKTVIQNLAKDSVKVIAGTNTTVTTGKDGDATTYAVNVSKDDIKAAVQSDLDAKANRDASNLTATDVKSWQDTLSHGGKVEAGNTSLITGDTVYNVVKNIELSAEKLVTTDGQTTYIDKNGTSTTIDVSHIGKDGKPEGRVIQGVVTDVDNPTSVVTVSTMSNALENLNANVGSQINALDRKLTKDVKHAGATAAALAALNPLPYDASNKLNFAVGQGRYRGENATALGVFYQPNEDVSFNLGGTISSGDKAMNAGVSFRIGSGNAAKKTVKQSEFDALKAENKAMAERLDALQKQIEGLKAINLATADRKPFPDVPNNHWAAEAVETLHANDVVEGYEDGEFKGDKTMTRYEYAQMLYKAAHKA